MRITLVLALIIMACGAAGNATSSPQGDPPPTAPHEQLATLERTVCFGTCPDYKVTIFRDGIVEYQGEKFVKIVGRATGRLTRRQLAQLEELFRRNGYLGLESSYERVDATDLPSAFTSYSPASGETKAIRHYQGDRSAPEALTRVEQGIDRIVNIEQWIGTPEERQHVPRT